MGKNNLKTATKKSIQESKVSQLDNFGSSTKDFLQEGSLTAIENAVGDFIDRVHKNIDKEKGMVTTGKINQIDIKAENGGINIYAWKHLIYQDRGVNGSQTKLYQTPHAYSNKMPPVDVFKQWIKEKKIRLVNEKKMGGDDSTFKELTEEELINKAAWGMATNVFKHGFKPRHIYSKEIPQLVKDIEAQITGFVIQGITQTIDVKPTARRVIISK